MSIIEVAHVTRTYGKGATAFTAVNNVSLSVERGELVALLGVNGAGKTSLVELIEGLAPATSGQIRVLGGDPVKNRAQIRPHTGIMLQEAGFAGALTVKETVHMWAGTLTNPRPVEEGLALTDLTHRANVRVKSLSGGERRRLDLTLATLGRPQILFLDEPTTGLDPASRRRTWDLIRGMLNEGTTVLLTTHYLEEAEELADRVLIMAGGQIRVEGTIPQIVAGQPSYISFASHPQLSDDALAQLPALCAPITHERGRTRLSSRNLQVTLTSLLHGAENMGLRLENLDARAASLEQAFLAFTQEQSAQDSVPGAPGSSHPTLATLAPAAQSVGL
ncbi:MAG: ABC transporter ATP-binding protein [Actinomycetaceae bacterium]|nr:ABC transporter ATP-binding protein [Actinomycetaceae bacterium]